MRSLFAVPLVLLLASCGGTDYPIDPSESQVIEAAKFVPIDSPETFQAALSEVGNATGWGFGKFAVNFGHATYSNDCEASFLLGHQFTVDDQFTLEEVEEKIEKGVGEKSGFWDVYYREGHIWFLDVDGDGTDLKGVINDDGRFRIVSGEYPRSDNCRFQVYEGSIDGEIIEGKFWTVMHSWEDEPVGSCRVELTFRGQFTHPTYPPDPPDSN